MLLSSSRLVRDLTLMTLPFSPPFHVAHLTRVADIVPLYQYGPEFKSARRMMAGFMGTWSVLERFHPSFERETSRLLKALVDEPDDLLLHVHRCVDAVHRFMLIRMLMLHS